MMHPDCKLPKITLKERVEGHRCWSTEKRNNVPTLLKITLGQDENQFKLTLN